MTNSYASDFFRMGRKEHKFHFSCSKVLRSFVLFITLIFAGAASAQTVANHNLTCVIPPPPGKDPCTSNDLQVVGVSIVAPACASCTPGQTVTYPLKMTIHNGTNSERTSFALYGTLSSGASINGYSGNIFVCVGPITVKSNQTLAGETAPGNQTFAAGTITFTCGQNLTLTNNYLAWTDASGITADRCNTFLNATSCANIAPKCGTAASITITGPVVPPTLGGADPTCTVSTGSITLSPATGSTYSFDGGSYVAYPSGGWTGLVAGSTHTVSAKRSDGCTSPNASRTIGAAKIAAVAPTLGGADPTCTVATGSCTLTPTTGSTYSFDGGSYLAYPSGGWTGLAASSQHTVSEMNTDGCTSQNASRTIGAAKSKPDAPTVCIVPPSLCDATKTTFKIKIATPTGTGYKYSIDNGSTWPDDPVFCNVAAGSNPIMKVKSADGCISDGTSCTSNKVSICTDDPACPVTNANRMRTDNYQTTEQKIVVKEPTKVTAYPNPFNNKVKFIITSAVAGKGSLEVYNTLGQKVKSVYQGQIIAGNQSFELSLPSTQRSNLIYVLRVGDKRVTGKLLHLNR